MKQKEEAENPFILRETESEQFLLDTFLTHFLFLAIQKTFPAAFLALWHVFLHSLRFFFDIFSVLHYVYKHLLYYIFGDENIVPIMLDTHKTINKSSPDHPSPRTGR